MNLIHLSLLAIYTFFWVTLIEKVKKRWNIDAYITRKIFHCSIFLGASLILVWGNFVMLATYGGLVATFVLYAVKKGEGSFFYQAIARPSDAPYQKFYILMPLFMTALGGLINYVLFDSLAILGILVTGFGDAAAEIVGKKWGKRAFSVPSLGRISCQKTVEGTISFFLVSYLAAVIALLILGISFSASLWMGFGVAIVACITEILTIHGFDNLTVQIMTCLTAYWMSSAI